MSRKEIFSFRIFYVELFWVLVIRGSVIRYFYFEILRDKSSNLESQKILKYSKNGSKSELAFQLRTLVSSGYFHHIKVLTPMNALNRHRSEILIAANQRASLLCQRNKTNHSTKNCCAIWRIFFQDMRINQWIKINQLVHKAYITPQGMYVRTNIIT